MTRSEATPRVIAVEEAYGSESWIREINEVLVPAGERPDQSYMSRSPLAQAVSSDGGGTIRLVAEPTAGAAQAAIRGGKVDAAIVAAAAATAGLQAALNMPGTLIAIIGMVVFGDPTAGTSISTALLPRPWNVIGQGLPPSAGLSAARSILYLSGTKLTGPLTVLAVYAAAGTLLTLAAAAWRHHRPVSPATQPRPA